MTINLTAYRLKSLLIATFALLAGGLLAAPAAQASSVITYDVSFSASAGINGDLYLTVNDSYVDSYTSGGVTYYQWLVVAATGSVTFAPTTGDTSDPGYGQSQTVTITSLFNSSSSSYYIYTTESTLSAASEIYLDATGIKVSTDDSALALLFSESIGINVIDQLTIAALDSTGQPSSSVDLPYIYSKLKGKYIAKQSETTAGDATQVPEPLSLALVAGGLILLGLFARRGGRPVAPTATPAPLFWATERRAA